MQGGTRGRRLLAAAGKGAVCGLAGVAVMTAGEKAEQIMTKRPNSYVPARTLLTLLGRTPRQAEKPFIWNHLMHWGTGAAQGRLLRCNRRCRRPLDSAPARIAKKDHQPLGRM